MAGPNAAIWATQPVVTVEDSGGNKVSTSTASVTLAVAAERGWHAGLHQPDGRPPTAGVATFAGCKITGTAGTYSLSATATRAQLRHEHTFTITAGAGSQLAFTTQPGGGG